jgi:short-subunit dehydrogenase
MELSGSRVLVTGGSRGIGEALARRFAAEGARVALVARSAAANDQLVAELGGTAHAADLTDPRQVGGLVERIEAEGGPVDVLVNNAGVDGVGTFDDETAEDLEHLFRLNLLTPAELTRQVLPGMLRRGRGHLVNISSLAGCAVFPGMAGYSSSKAGLSHLTAGLRADLRGTPIGTTLVELGPIPTEMLDRVEGCEPVRASFQRLYRLRLLVDVDREVVARTVVDAVRAGRRHVRHPKRALAFPLLSEAPRRVVELLLTGVQARVGAPDEQVIDLRDETSVSRAPGAGPR